MRVLARFKQLTFITRYKMQTRHESVKKKDLVRSSSPSFIILSVPRLVPMSLASLNRLFKLKTIVLDQHHLCADINRYSSLVSSFAWFSTRGESNQFVLLLLLFPRFLLFWNCLNFYCFHMVCVELWEKKKKKHSQQVPDL